MSIKSLLGCSIIVAVSAVGGLMVHRSALDAAEDMHEVVQAKEAQRMIQDCAATVEQADTAYEAALLTGDRGYLLVFRAALPTLREKVQSLLAASSDDPLLAADVGQLRKQAERRWTAANVAAESGRGKRERGAATALGRADSKELREAIGKLEAAVNASLSVQRERYQADSRKTGELFVALLVAQCGGSILLFVASSRVAHSRSELGFELLQSNVRLFAILGTIDEGIFQLDRGGGLVYLNPAAERILGYSLSEVSGKPLFDLAQAQTLSRGSDSESIQAKSIRAGEPIHQAQGQFRRKDGAFISVEYTSQPLIVAGRVVGALLCVRDITERKNIEDALRDSEGRYRALVEKSEGLICSHDMRGYLLSINKAVAAVFGQSPEALVGKNLREMLVPRFRPQLDSYLGKMAEWGMHRGLMRVVDGNGEELIWAYSNRTVNESGKEPYVLGHAQDITAQIHAERELQVSLDDERSLSRVDFLTGIPNRRAFYEAVEREASRCKRYRRPFTLVYLDVDNFKTVNNDRGHEEGDRLLRSVAAKLRKVTRQTDTVARLGGDEFAILLCESDVEAAVVATKGIERALIKLVQEQSWDVSFSIGARTFRQPGETVDRMVKLADELMYEVKKSGKNAVASRVS